MASLWWPGGGRSRQISPPRPPCLPRPRRLLCAEMTMTMEMELSESDLARYTAAQLNAFFPDRAVVEESDLRAALSPALKRLQTIHRCIDGRFYRRNGKAYFDHLHGDQYSSYLYLLSWYVAQQGGEREQRIATKLFGLNKALHAIDLYFEVELPEVFLL